MQTTVIKILMRYIKEQHSFRFDDCSEIETIESFDKVKSRIIEDLLSSGCRDFKMMSEIQGI